MESNFPSCNFTGPSCSARESIDFAVGNKFFPTDGTWIIRIKSQFANDFDFSINPKDFKHFSRSLYLCTSDLGRRPGKEVLSLGSSQFQVKKLAAFWTGVFLALPQTFWNL